MSSRIQILSRKSQVVFWVSMGPEYSVRVTEPAASGSWRILDKKWADVLPNDLTLLCNLENPAWSTFADQGITVWKSFSATDVVAVER